MIFWYFLLGPGAALAYRLLALSVENSRQPALKERAEQLRHALDWLPVRVLALSFALVGNFVAVVRVMLHELLNWHISAGHLVARVGRVADSAPEEEDTSGGSVVWTASGSCCCVARCCGMPALRCGRYWSECVLRLVGLVSSEPGLRKQRLTLNYKPWVRSALYKSPGR